MLRRIIPFIFMQATVVVHAQNRAIQFETRTWNEVKTKAQQESKMIFVDAYAVWCGPCKWMAKNVFSNDTVADYYNANFVNYKIDMEKGEGIELAKQWSVGAYPTLLYFSPEGKLLHRSCGSSESSEFVQLGMDARNPEKQFTTALEKYESGSASPEFIKQYIFQLKEICLPYEAESQKYFASLKDEELFSSDNWDMINKTVTDINSRAFVFLENNFEKFVALYGKEVVEKKVEQVYNASIKKAIRGTDTNVTYEQLSKKISEKKTPVAEKAIALGDMEFYKKQADWKKYAVSADRYVTNYALEDFNMLNNVAWTFYEHITDKTMLEKAVGWAKKSTVLKDAFFNNDTYASLLYKCGKKTEAQQVALKAIELAKKEGSDTADTEELLKKINALKD